MSVEEKNLYEALDDLFEKVAGTTAEPSFEFIVETLLRCAVTQSPTRFSEVVRTVGRWQAVRDIQRKL